MEGLEPPKCLDQNQVPYHLATPQWKVNKGDRDVPDPLVRSGVDDGTRTHNARNHNPVLCQLN